MEKRILKTKEAAEYLGIHFQRVNQLVLDDKIPFINISKGEKPIYRFDKERLDEWLDDDPTL